MAEQPERFEIGVISVAVRSEPDPWRDLAPKKAAVSGDFLVNARTGRLVVVEPDGSLTLTEHD